MKYLSTILAGVAALFCALWLHECSRPEPVHADNSYLERIASLEKQIEKDDSVISALEASRDEQKRQYHSDSLRLSSENSRLSASYTRAKQQVQELTDTSGRISAYIAASDSIISIKDSTIAVERNYRLAGEKLHTFEIAAVGEKYMNQKAISDVLQARVEALEVENADLVKKLERKTRANGVLKGISAGLAAALAVTILSQ